MDDPKYPGTGVFRRVPCCGKEVRGCRKCSFPEVDSIKGLPCMYVFRVTGRMQRVWPTEDRCQGMERRAPSHTPKARRYYHTFFIKYWRGFPNALCSPYSTRSYSPTSPPTAFSKSLSLGFDSHSPSSVSSPETCL